MSRRTTVDRDLSFKTSHVWPPATCRVAPVRRDATWSARRIVGARWDDGRPMFKPDAAG